MLPTPECQMPDDMRDLRAESLWLCIYKLCDNNIAHPGLQLATSRHAVHNTARSHVDTQILPVKCSYACKMRNADNERVFPTNDGLKRPSPAPLLFQILHSVHFADSRATLTALRTYCNLHGVRLSIDPVQA